MAKPLIAVVENDPILQRVLSELLTEEDYRVLLRGDGRGTAAVIQAEQPALIVLDIKLEDSDAGWRLLEQFQQDSATRHIPVIVCSAAGPALHERAEHLRACGVEVLAKPFDLNHLLARITATLTRCGDVTDTAV
jgi:DNA-binding response OmpR family regulator